jgi:nucleotide-binding universal stress UspA family protein
MKQIVVGFLDVDTAHKALRQAAELAHRLDAKLHVVTAIESPNVEVVTSGGDRWVLSDFDRAQQAIDDFMATVSPAPRYTVAVVEGKPAEVLIAEAERLDADLIVVGNVRMQGPGRILGSVGNHVAHHAPCSVLISKTV